jgi:hypothetical protein
VGAAIGTLLAVAIAVCGLWALAAIVETGSSPWGVLTGLGSGLVFWGWIVAGCWARAHEPEPDPLDPAPVPRSAAFVAANVVLAVLFTALVAGGLWAGVRSARDAERVDLISHRVLVAARAADVTVDGLRRLEVDRQAWIASSSSGAVDDPDPADELLPVEGASVVDVAARDDTAAVLFRPDDGLPCVVLDIDADGLLSTRSTTDC